MQDSSPGNEQPQKLVFVSYATPDRPAMEAFVAQLEDSGIPCWIAPRDVQPGSNYGASIVEAICFPFI